MAVSVCVAYAGDDPKEDKVYIPEEGDFAVGFDAAPILGYIGNLFNGNQNNGFGALAGTPFTSGNDFFNGNIMPDVSIMGKYMFTDNLAVKMNVGLMISSRAERSYTRDDAAGLNNPLSEAKVIDTERYNRTGVSIMLGGEYRLGKRRIQGVLGAGLLFAAQNENLTNIYGNAMTAANQTPSTAITSTAGDGRVVKRRNDGANFYVGVTGSVGVDWFVAPKISLGAEVNISAYYMFGAQEYEEREWYNTLTSAVETKTNLLSPGDGRFVFGTESLGGALAITFWF